MTPDRRPRNRIVGGLVRAGLAATAALLIAAALYAGYAGPEAFQWPGSQPWRLATQGGRFGTIRDRELPRLRRAAAVVDPELMSQAAGEYNQSFANPCWIDPKLGLRCLPAFFVSGSFGGGASLSRLISEHPSVVHDAGGFGVWGHKWGYWSEYRNDMASYVTSLTAASEAKLREQPGSALVMDAAHTTKYLYWAGSGKAHRAFSDAAVACWRRCHEHDLTGGEAYDTCMEEVCLTAGRAADEATAAAAGLRYDDMQLPMLMRAMYGARMPKFVFVLREPCDRLWSAYKGTPALNQRYGNTTTGFVHYARDQIMAWRSCVTRHGERDCLFRFETLSMEQEKVFYHCDQLLRGMYASWLKVWFRFFPREQFLIVNADEYFEKPHLVVKKVVDFLGLSPPDNATLERMYSASEPLSWTGEWNFIPEGARRLLSKHVYNDANFELAVLMAGHRKEDKWEYKEWSRWNRETWQRRRR